MSKFVFLLHLVLLSLTVSASVVESPESNGYLEFSEEIKKAYRLILSLRLDEGRAVIERIKVSEPNNALVYLVEDYIDFFTLFIGEDKASFERLVKNKKIRLKQIKASDRSSPYYLYAQAEINLHWALVRIKFEQRFRAFREISNAYSLLTENEERFPNFLPNKKGLGVLHATLGTIPDKYKWGVKFISGMEGTIEQGLAELESLILYAQESNYFFADEALILYAFIQLHLNNNAQIAFELTQRAELDIRNNPLACFVKANIAMRSGHNDEAIEILLDRPQGVQYLDFDYLDFSLGLAKLRRLDSDADEYLLKFVKNFKGMNYIKEAYQKLAWHALIFDGQKRYKRYIKQCLAQGYAIVDEDKSAKQEGLGATVPHVGLLKVRLLSDGGYYERALEQMEKADVGFDEGQHIEWLYRKARLYQQTKRIGKALELFDVLLQQWSDNPSYMICNAALQSAILYEQRGSAEQAQHYFELCLKKNPNQYKTGLHQKAKAGLVRLGLSG